MKRIIDLPKAHRRKALAYAKRHHPTKSERELLNMDLLLAFNWASTGGGKAFWEKLYKSDTKKSILSTLKFIGVILTIPLLMGVAYTVAAHKSFIMGFCIGFLTEVIGCVGLIFIAYLNDKYFT